MIKIFGVRIDDPSMKEAIDKISSWIKLNDNQTKLISTLNPEILMQAKTNLVYREILNHSALTVVDGGGIKLVTNLFLNKKIEHKVQGIDLIHELMETGLNHNWKWFFLGGAPGIGERAATRVRIKYPDIQIVGIDDGGEVQLEKISEKKPLADKIKQSGADILIVSFGAPKQEMFIDYFKDLLGAKIAIGAGGSLDFISGQRRRAPYIFQILYIEWAWRLINEPSRYKRIWTAVINFPVAAIKDKLRTNA